MAKVRRTRRKYRQLSLFSPLVIGIDPPRQQHSPTSVQAAEAIAERTPSLRQRLLVWLQSCGQQGATDEEMQLALAMNPSTQRPRRIELCRLGLVRDSGQQRRTRSNREATVWIAG